MAATRTPKEPAADSLLSKARSGGRKVAEGRFRLDWRRAIEKIKRYKLSEPHHYVLELVRSAVAAGASRIDIEMDADDMVMRFDGRHFTYQELNGLFDHLFTRDPDHRRLQALALGINTGLGMNPKFLSVKSGDGQEGVILRMSKLSDFHLDRSEGAHAPEGTSVHLRERKSWKVIAEALWRPNPEEAVIKEHCCFAPVPVWFDGQDVRRVLLDDAYLYRTFSQEGIRGRVALPAPLWEQSEVSFCMNGVRVVRATSHLGTLAKVGLAAWVDNPELARNASHSDVVRDKEYLRTLAVLRMEFENLLRTWLKMELLQKGDEPEGIWRYRIFADSIRARTRRHYLALAARTFLRDGKSGDPEIEALLNVPDLLDLPLQEPETGPLRPLWEAFHRDGSCLLASRRYRLTADDLPRGMAVALGPEPMLRAIFGKKLKPVDDWLAEIERRKKLRESNRREREGRRQSAILAKGEFLIQLPIRSGDPELAGEVGLSYWELSTEPVCRITFLRDQVPLERKEIVDPPFHGQAVIDSPAFEPNDLWDGVREDLNCHQAVQAVREAAPALLQALSKAHPSPPPSEPLLRLDTWTLKSEVSPVPRDGWIDMSTRWARKHIDHLLSGYLSKETSQFPWLWDWPIFHTLGFDSMSLAEIAARDKIWYVKEKPWGEGPADGPVLNLSKQLAPVLKKVFGPRLRHYASALTRRRKRLAQEARKERRRLAREARRRERYQANRARAEALRQNPRLKPDRYLAVVDLDLGTGQAGVPKTDPFSYIRFLYEGLPVYEKDLPENYLPFPVQAVIEVPGAEPNATFDGIRPRRVVNWVQQAVRDLVDDLAGAVASNRESGDAGRRVLWSYLRKKSRSAGFSLKDVPSRVRNHPLVPTTTRGFLGLDELEEMARTVKLARVEPGLAPEKTPELILIMNALQGRDLGRLLGSRIRDRTGEFEQALRIRERKKASAVPAVLKEPCALRVRIASPGYEGEVGLGPLYGKGAVEPLIRVLKDGRPLQELPMTIHGFPLVAVIGSSRFRANETWDAVVRDRAWRAGKIALEEAAGRLVTLAFVKLRRGRFKETSKRLVCRVFQVAAGRRFKGLAEKLPENATGVESVLATAPVWETTKSGEWVSLLELSRQREEQGAVWMVTRGPRLPRRGRLIVHAPEAHTQKALKSIFGEFLKSGGGVLEEDLEGFRRREQAPRLVAGLPKGRVLVSETFAHAEPDGSLEIRGEVGPPASYAAAWEGIVLEVGANGRRLCELKLTYPLRAVGIVNCVGIEVNPEWTEIADRSQAGLLARVVGGALWRLADRLCFQFRLFAPGSDLRSFLLHAAGCLHENPLLSRRLMDLPLVETVEGQFICLARIRRELQRAKVLVVSDGLPHGHSGKDRLILRVDSFTQGVLERLLGVTLEGCDDEWRQEKAARRNRTSDEGILQDAQLIPLLGEAKVQALPTKRLIQFKKGWVLNAKHPVWRATKQARAKLDPDGPDPALHLSAAVAAELRGRPLSADSVVAHMELLAERALGKENREAAAV